MAANTLQLESRARRILTDLRLGINSAHIEEYLGVKRLSDYLRKHHNSTVSAWRAHPHSIVTFTPVSDELEELQVQRSSLAKLTDGGDGTHLRRFWLFNGHVNGSVIYDKVHGNVYFIQIHRGKVWVEVFPYLDVKNELAETGIRLQHVRTSVPVVKHVLKVF